MSRDVINRTRDRLAKHRAGGTKDQLTTEELENLLIFIQAAEEYMANYKSSDGGAYESDDPKHPTYTERALDNADYERKRRREEGE